MDKPKFYLTTPIYYANSRPHVGSAYTTIVCDVIARYKRMSGFDVAYLTGTDEHGVNIERAAEKAGITPRQLVDRNVPVFRDLWKLLGISQTHFVRTTSPEHAHAVQELIRRTRRITPDAIFKRKYEGRYCIYDNLYVSDSPEPANCPVCGRPGELVSEENYFFRLSAYQDKLLELYSEQPDFVQPAFRRNEVVSFVEAGLRDISISRKSIKWGIPWPDDPEHVFYVWYDALTSYISGLGYGEGPNGGVDFQKYWPADVHFIGKEIIRFHAVYWPAFLMAADLPLPKKIFAHGWLLFEQQKMSKSKGNVAYPEPIVKGFENPGIGNDALRYYLLREVVFGQDGNFGREALLTRYNADLANGIGNLASRILAMIVQYFDGAVPLAPTAVSGEFAAKLVASANETIAIARAEYDKYNFTAAIQQTWQLIADVDGYLVQEKPWKLAEDPAQRERLGEILYAAAESLRIATVLAAPVIPHAAEIIWRGLGQEDSVEHARTDSLAWGALRPGTRISKPASIFPRVDIKQLSERIETMEDEIRNAAVPAATGSSTAAPSAPTTPAPAATAAATSAAAVPAPANAKISIEDFAKVELRVGVVKSAERVAGADKLLKLLVDIGDEIRQIVAGIATAYTPEELVGRKVVIVANLAPRKLRGVESNGMIVAASIGPEGKPVLCTFTEDVPPGARLK